MNEQELEIAKETVRLLRDYPELSYQQAKDKAIEMLIGSDKEVLNEQSHRTTRETR